MPGEIKVNDLPLPQYLVELINQGRWKKPDDVSALKALTGIADFSFLAVDFMNRETTGVEQKVSNPKFADIYGLASSKQRGAEIEESSIVDVDCSVLIAINLDEGVIFLDYRANRDEPRVVVSVRDNKRGCRYKIIAPNFESFARQ